MLPRSSLLIIHPINGGDIAGALPRARAEQFEVDRRAALKQRRTFACDQRKKGQVQFVDQLILQQMIPQRAACEDKNIPAWLLFERSNLLWPIRSFDDARIVRPLA